MAVAAAIPWRTRFSSRDLTGELPAAGALALFDHLDRGWPAFESAVTTVFDYDLWLVIVPLVGVTAILALLAGARVLPTYALALYLLVIGRHHLGAVVVHGARASLPPAGQGVIRSSALRIPDDPRRAAPLLLDAAWRGTDNAAPEES